MVFRKTKAFRTPRAVSEPLLAISEPLRAISEPLRAPPLPFELIIHILSFLPWEQVVGCYSTLPTALIDIVLSQHLSLANRNSDRPLFSLLSSMSDASFISDIWLNYAGLDRDARILWLVPDATRTYFLFDPQLSWYSYFSLSLLGRASKEMGWFYELLPYVKVVSRKEGETREDLLARLRGSRFRLCGLDYIVEGYMTACVASYDDLVELEEAMRLDDDEFQAALQQEQLPLSDIIEAYETANSPHRPPTPVRRILPQTIFSSTFPNYKGALFVDRVGITFNSFLASFSHAFPGSSKFITCTPTDPSGITTLFPRRIRRVQQVVQDAYPSFCARELMMLRAGTVRVGWSASYESGEGMSETDVYMMLFREEILGGGGEMDAAVRARAKKLQSLKNELKRLKITTNRGW